MPLSPFSWFFTIFLCFLVLDLAFAGDPFVYYDWTVSYVTASPLGVKQKVFFSFSFALHTITSLDLPTIGD